MKKTPKPAPKRAAIPAAIPEPATVVGICADIVDGLDLRTACRAHGVPLATMRRGLASRAASWAPVQAQVLAAQVTVQRDAARDIAKAAAAGAPAALAVMAARLTAPPDLLDEPPADPVLWIRWRLRDVQRRIGSADGIAYNQLARMESDLRAQLKTATADTGEGRTPAQVMASEQAHARELADVHLQVYAYEYLRRHPGVFLSTSAGRIEIVA
jgi:hypothetical protein